MLAPEVPFDEVSRLDILHSLDILDTLPEERFDRLTRLAKRLFGVPTALISFIDSNRHWTKSNAGPAAKEVPSPSRKAVASASMPLPSESSVRNADAIAACARSLFILAGFGLAIASSRSWIIRAFDSTEKVFRQACAQPNVNAGPARPLMGF